MNLRYLITIFTLFILIHGQISFGSDKVPHELMSLLEEPNNEGVQKDDWSCGPCAASAWLRLYFFCNDINAKLPSYQKMREECPRFYIRDLQEKLVRISSVETVDLEDKTESEQIGPSMFMLQTFLTQWVSEHYPNLSLTFSLEKDLSDNMKVLKELLTKGEKALLLIKLGLRQHTALPIGSFPWLHFVLVLAYDIHKQLFFIRDSDGEIKEIPEIALKQQWHWSFEGDSTVVDFLNRQNITGGQLLALNWKKT